MNTTIENFEYFGFEEVIDDKIENVEHFYHAIGKRKGEIIPWDVFVTHFEDDTFCMEAFKASNTEERILSIGPVPLRSIYDILDLVKMLDLEIKIDRPPQYHLEKYG